MDRYLDVVICHQFCVISSQMIGPETSNSVIVVSINCYIRFFIKNNFSKSTQNMSIPASYVFTYDASIDIYLFIDNRLVINK